MEMLRKTALVALLCSAPAFAQSPVQPGPGPLPYSGSSSPPTPVSIANGGTACSTVNCSYGLPNFRKKLAGLKSGSGNLLAGFVGDSTTIGSYSTSVNGSGDIVIGSYPTQLVKVLSSYGIKTENNNFFGDGDPEVIRGQTADGRLTIGTSWTPDTATYSIGGAAFMASTNTNALSFTPRINVDTFKFL
jgi:hypothetical protein